MKGYIRPYYNYYPTVTEGGGEFSRFTAAGVGMMVRLSQLEVFWGPQVLGFRGLGFRVWGFRVQDIGFMV